MSKWQNTTSSMPRDNWPARYVGIPFSDNGHAFDGCNCWGLVHLVLDTECDVAVPAYSEISASQLLAAARAMSEGRKDDTWLPVMRNALKPFDGVMMRSMTNAGSRVENHVGIIAPTSDGLKVLHVWLATAACLMRLDHPRIRHRIVGFYRHRELA
jgi:hypothetical protein